MFTNNDLDERRTRNFAKKITLTTSYKFKSKYSNSVRQHTTDTAAVSV